VPQLQLGGHVPQAARAQHGGKVSRLAMDIERTKAYYAHLGSGDLCDCAYCQNYMKEIKASYSALAEYLRRMGVDIEKPFETMPLDPDEMGHLAYPLAQYIVCGDPNDFRAATIQDVHVDISTVHPATGIQEPHFVIDVYPICLKWVM
jgi:hypothetical protein